MSTLDMPPAEQASSTGASPLDYRFNEGSLPLPEGMVDKTAHMFMQANGKQEFNIVIARSEVKPDEGLDAFTDRLIDEYQRTLTRFHLEKRESRTVAQVPAELLTYTWRANNVVLHQRQAVMIVPGATPKQFTGLLVTGTCQSMFVHPYNDLFEQALAGLALRHQHAPVAANDEPQAVEEAAYAFALASDGTLHVFTSVADMHAAIGALEVEDGGWKFYDNDGHALKVVWQTPNKRSLRKREAGVYTLEQADARTLGPLQNRFATVLCVQDGATPLHTLELVYAHLKERQANTTSNTSSLKEPPHA